MDKKVKIECGLCHTTDNPCITPCKHNYCYQCLMKWISDKMPDINCPLDSCGEPFGSFNHSGNRRYVIEIIYPGDTIPKPKRARKPKGQMAQVLAPENPPAHEEEEPPREGNDGLDGARGDHGGGGVYDDRGDLDSFGGQGRDRGGAGGMHTGQRGYDHGSQYPGGYGPSGRYGNQGGEDRLGFGGGLGGFNGGSGGNFTGDYFVDGHGVLVYDYRHRGYSERVREGARGFPGELSYEGEFRGYLTGQDYPRGRSGFGGQERTVMEHYYRESVPRTEAPRIGMDLRGYRSGGAVEFGDREGVRGGDRNGYSGNRGDPFFGDSSY